MKIATWNVNSIKVRAPQVCAWLQASGTDVLAMQEIKTTDDLFPHDAFDAAGYDTYVFGQKTYNGVALAVRRETVAKVEDVVTGIPHYPDEQKRFIAATITGKDGALVRLAGVYVPNGQAVGCDKYLYKLDWLSALTHWTRAEIAAGNPLMIVGDYNIAPTDADVWNPENWKGNILVSEPERSALKTLLAAGLTDTWNLELHDPETYSWWDYRQSGFEKNHGLRIDLMLAAEPLTQRIKDVAVDTAPRATEKPSDHAPVVLTLSA